jgi:hypothetical protein
VSRVSDVKHASFSSKQACCPSLSSLSYRYTFLYRRRPEHRSLCKQLPITKRRYLASLKHFNFPRIVFSKDVTWIQSRMRTLVCHDLAIEPIRKIIPEICTIISRNREIGSCDDCPIYRCFSRLRFENALRPRCFS